MIPKHTVIDGREELEGWLARPENEGAIVKTKLQASDRVIARVTDGIYRQPASALRELISNAWDADATQVTILTDAPRFSRIYVRDDGLGMSHETLARLIKEIGGSAKRRPEGQKLGVTNPTDNERSPGGRQIIGKIGIGLFSVSQLSRKIEIITKPKGERYRLFAEVRLRTYSEDHDEDVFAEDNDTFISGEVFIRRENADDIDAHGTDIILDDIKGPVREILRSADRWKGVIAKERARNSDDQDGISEYSKIEEPQFHSGYLGDLSRGGEKASKFEIAPQLPWTQEDHSSVRMLKLVKAVEGQFTRIDRPDLAHTLDYYLEMIWTLGLSAPVDYVESHPFDLKQDGRLQLYWVAKERGKGVPVHFPRGKTVRQAVLENVKGNPHLEDGADPVGGFNVNIDGTELRRPIRFKFHKTEKRGLDTAVMFVGQLKPDLSSVPSSQSGGNLLLEAYLFWTGRIIPKENNGVLVRIRGASGALFDPTFFKYQVSEQTRLRQITSEIFVQKGLDAALNIDRESFNFAHPHLQMVTFWLHAAIRQLTNRLKDEAASLRRVRQASEAEVEQRAASTVAETVWRTRRGTEMLPDVIIAGSDSEAQKARAEGNAALVRSALPTLQRSDKGIAEAKAAALLQVLLAYDLLQDRTYSEQQEIVNTILGIFLGEA